MSYNVLMTRAALERKEKHTPLWDPRTMLCVTRWPLTQHHVLLLTSRLWIRLHTILRVRKWGNFSFAYVRLYSGLTYSFCRDDQLIFCPALLRYNTYNKSHILKVKFDVFWHYCHNKKCLSIFLYFLAITNLFLLIKLLEESFYCNFEILYSSFWSSN